MARPRAEDYDDKRKAILRTAAELFAELGFDRASMSEIAGRCGVSKALLYHYYTNKDALLYDVIRHHLDDLIAAVEAAGDPRLPPEDRLLAKVTALLEAYRDADAEHKVQLNDMKRLPAAEQEALRAQERRLVQLFAETIAQSIPTLGDGSALLKPVTMSLFGMMNWHYLWFRDSGPVSRGDYAGIATRIILDGARSLAAPVPHTWS